MYFIRVDDIQQPRPIIKENNVNITSGCDKKKEASCWGNYARGALYALQRKNDLSKVNYIKL